MFLCFCFLKQMLLCCPCCLVNNIVGVYCSVGFLLYCNSTTAHKGAFRNQCSCVSNRLITLSTLKQTSQRALSEAAYHYISYIHPLIKLPSPHPCASRLIWEEEGDLFKTAMIQVVGFKAQGLAY